MIRFAKRDRLVPILCTFHLHDLPSILNGYSIHKVISFSLTILHIFGLLCSLATLIYLQF